MLAIKHALNKLHASLGHLEQSMDHLESKLAGQQREMFPEACNQNSGVGDVHGTTMVSGTDKVAVIAKIDGAIAKVESVLKEAEG